MKLDLYIDGNEWNGSVQERKSYSVYLLSFFPDGCLSEPYLGNITRD